jgi:hypothetical protein
VISGQHGDDAICFTQFVGAQDNRFISIGRHGSIVADRVAIASQDRG